MGQAQDIWLKFIDEHPELLKHNDLGHGVINYIAQEKSDIAVKAIEFTLKQLEIKD